MLCCYLVPRASELTDEIGDLLISITRKISARAESRVIKELVTEFRKVEGKTALLFKMALAADGAPDGRIRDVIFPVVSQKTIKDLANGYRAKNPSFQSRVHHKVRRSFSHHYRRILPVILKTLTFRSNTPACRPLLEAIEILKDGSGRTPRSFACGDVPLAGVVQPRQRDIVMETGPDGRQRINRLNYEICVLQSLRERLRIKDVWIEGADRYRNPDLDLPQDFEARKAHYCRDLNQPLDADHFVERLKGEPVTALEAFDRNLPANDSVALTSRGGKPRIALKPLKAQEDPAMLTALKAELARRWPMASLLDVLKETDLRIGFTKSFPTAAARQSLPAAEVSRRLLLALYGIGTNIGLHAIAALSTTSVTFTSPQVTWTQYTGRLGDMSPPSLTTVFAEVFNAETGARVGGQNIVGPIGSGDISVASRKTSTISSLAAKTRYYVELFAGATGSVPRQVFGRRCFMTGGTYTMTVAPGTQGQSSGCYSISEFKGTMETFHHVRNCWCGRRTTLPLFSGTLDNSNFLYRHGCRR